MDTNLERAIWDNLLDARSGIRYYQMMAQREKRFDHILTVINLIAGSGVVGIWMFQKFPILYPILGIIILATSIIQKTFNFNENASIMREYCQFCENRETIWKSIWGRYTNDPSSFSWDELEKIEKEDSRLSLSGVKQNTRIAAIAQRAALKAEGLC